jgi:hypothetical protein
MAEEKTKYYRFIGTFSPEERFEQVEVEPGKIMKRNGDPVSLTDGQHEKLARYIVMEEVPEEEALAIEQVVDQPGPFGPSTSTLVTETGEPVANVGTTPDFGAMSFDDKKELAKAIELPGRSKKSEEELTTMLIDYYNDKTHGAVI